MKNLKAIGILGVLAVTALTLVGTAPASGNGSFLITGMVSRLKRFCAPGELRPACRYLANLVVPASPFLDELVVGKELPPDQVEQFRRIAVARMGPLVAPERTCDGCRQKVHDFEELLAANDTIADVVDMMDDACAARFRKDGALATQCATEVRRVVAPLVDLVLQELPPSAACSIGARRPMNLCANP
ncbi:saposin domain-containing protein [Candidatus Binatia bacterium]|jgi:hypothetical protein|nr:saposin domain-containing protein [Candidatus Binatia bacterium]